MNESGKNEETSSSLPLPELGLEGIKEAVRLMPYGVLDNLLGIPVVFSEAMPKDKCMLVVNGRVQIIDLVEKANRPTVEGLIAKLQDAMKQSKAYGYVTISRLNDILKDYGASPEGK